LFQFQRGLLPEWASSHLPAFPQDAHTCGEWLSRIKFQIGDAEIGGFTGARARVVEEEQKCIVALPVYGCSIRRGQQRLDLMFIEVGHQLSHRLFERYRSHLSRPCHMLWTMFCDKPCQCMDRCQSLIARVDTRIVQIHADSRTIQHTGVRTQAVQSGTACSEVF
jgi:hypothetical protein